VTRKQYLEHKRDWNAAVVDGRVLAFGDGSTMKSYPSKKKVKAAAREALEAGLPVRVVRVPLPRSSDVQVVAIHGHR
jgi:hypothetical protein